MKKLFSEFKDFIAKGNVLDLAVAVVMGGAFNGIVNALVQNIIMPLVGVLIGGLDFASLSITVGNANIAYGAFIQAIVNFLIIALSIFVFVKVLSKLKSFSGKKEEEEKKETPPEPTQSEVYLREIRDLLEKKEA